MHIIQKLGQLSLVISVIDGLPMNEFQSKCFVIILLLLLLFIVVQVERRRSRGGGGGGGRRSRFRLPVGKEGPFLARGRKDEVSLRRGRRRIHFEDAKMSSKRVVV